MSTTTILRAAAIATLLGVAACSGPQTVSNNSTTRAVDRAAGTDVSGAYPQQRDGTPGNPPGTAVSRAYDRATTSDTSGAYPMNQGMPGTAAGRAYDRATNSNTSGAAPMTQRGY